MHSQAYRLHPAASWVSQLQSSLHAVVARLSQRQALPRPAAPTRSSEAEALRDYAATFMKDDPRFADDLFAAANRHEAGVH
jgi:hypothetical protein